MSEVRRFVVTAADDASAALAHLADDAGLQVTGSQVVERTFLDTADGRLDRAGIVLEVRRPLDGSGAASLVWSEDGRTVATHPLSVPEAPRFADDLPPWPGADRLARALEMRALVSGPTVRSRLTVLAALDREEKTTARVVVDASALVGGASDGTELPVVVDLVVLRGYGREADRLQKRLVPGLGLEPFVASAAASARAVAGSPPFLRSKLDVALSPRATAADAWRTVLRALTDTMTANFAGTLADTDSEFLHDFRVAVRRTRSVLQEGRRVLPPEARDHFRVGFKWLGDVTTPQRDADVHLLDYPGLVAVLPADRAGALEPLRELLLDRQRRCHAQLVADLRSVRRALLGRDWAEFLAGEGPWPPDGGEGEPGADAPDALRPAVVVAAERIHKAHHRLVRDGRGIDDDSPPVALHDLRKDAKRLRYLLECFGSMFPAADIATAVKPLKALQDTLGTFQDTEVQAHALEDMADELVGGGAPAATLLAMGAVIEHVHARGAAARVEFADRFGSFDSHKVSKAYERLTEDAEELS